MRTRWYAVCAIVAATTALLIPQSPATGATQDSPRPQRAPSEFVALSRVDRSIMHEVRYATKENFVGERVEGYRQPMCITTRGTAQALSRAQQRLRVQGLSLKVFDCYRPQQAVDNFVRWAADLDDERMKAEYYPRVEKSRLFADGYIAERSGHSRGSTIDLTIVDAAGKELEMGTAFDFFDPLSATDNPAITGQARANRDLLVRVLGDEGFVNYAAEWWHFTHKPERFPDTYFDFPVARYSLTRGPSR